MNKGFFVVLILSGACGLTGAIATGGEAKKSGTSDKKPQTADLKAPEITDYKKWQVVNPKPYYIAQRIAAACGNFTAHMASHPSNTGKYIRVFVNEKGRKAMMEDSQPRFPVGTVIVKEKLPAANSTMPELLTVMIKQRAGYDPTKGDWEYIVTNGSSKKVYQRGLLARCQGCHVSRPDSDYIFRSYLPQPISAKSSNATQ